MKKIYLQEQVQKVRNCPKQVIRNMYKTISVLNKNYGINRSIDDELGGYILLVSNIIDIKMLKQDKLNGLIPEYTDIIKCKDEADWTSSLFLLSSDYSIVVVTTEELSKFLLE